MSNLENSRFMDRTSTNLGRAHRLPHVCTKIIYGKLGGYRMQEILMIYLTPERRLCFVFDQASSLQDSELSEEVLLEEVLCKSPFSPPARWGYLDLNPAPHHATLSFQLPRHGQPACWPATSVQPLYSELSSSPGRTKSRMLWRLPAFWAPTGRLWRASQLSGPYRPEPLPERMSDRMPVDRSIDLSILHLTIYQSIHPLAS